MRWLVLLGVVLLGAGCEAVTSRDGGADAGPPVGSVRLEASSLRLRAGSSIDLVVTALDQAGAPLEGRHVEYRSSAEYVVVINERGVALGLQAGTATVRALVEGVESNALELTVLTGAEGPMSLRFGSRPLSLSVGATRGFVLEVRDGAGNVRTDVAPSLRIDPPAIASVSDAGVLGLSAGQAELIATLQGATEARLPLTVASSASDTSLSLDWGDDVSPASTADKTFIVRWVSQEVEAGSAVDLGTPRAPDTLALFDQQTKLQDLATSSNGQALIDFSSLVEGRVLDLSLRGTWKGATWSSSTRRVTIRHQRDARWQLMPEVSDSVTEVFPGVDDGGAPIAVYLYGGASMRARRFNAGTRRWEALGRNILAEGRPTEQEANAMDAGRLPDGGRDCSLPFRAQTEDLNFMEWSTTYCYWPSHAMVAPDVAFGPGGAIFLAWTDEPFEDYRLEPGGELFSNARLRRLDPDGVWRMLGSVIEPVKTDDCRTIKVAVAPGSRVPTVVTACRETLVTNQWSVHAMSWDEGSTSWKPFAPPLAPSSRRRALLGACFEDADSLVVNLDEEGVPRSYRVESNEWSPLETNGVSSCVRHPGGSLWGVGVVADDVVAAQASKTGWSARGDLLDEAPIATTSSPAIAVSEVAVAASWVEGELAGNRDLHVSEWDQAALKWSRIGARVETSVDAVVLRQGLTSDLDGGWYVLWSESVDGGTPKLRAARSLRP